MIGLHILIQSNALLERSDMMVIIQNGKFWFYIAGLISAKKIIPANICHLFFYAAIYKESKIQFQKSQGPVIRGLVLFEPEAFKTKCIHLL
jgi:hypothetical protein